MQNTAKAVMEETGADLTAVDELALAELAAEDRLAFIAQTEGDLSAYLDESTLAGIGSRCLEDYRADCTAREEWAEKARMAIKRAVQAEVPKENPDFPWKHSSNASHPLLTTASLQFAARAYPAIVKGDEVVSCKVVGNDKGLPLTGPDGKPMFQLGGMPIVPLPQDITLQDGTVVPAGTPSLMTPQGPQPVPQDAQPEPIWVKEPGAKAKRANRVRQFMNYTVFYRMKGWEEDTDTLLHHLPIIGCGFRKIYSDNSIQRSAYVSALKLVAPMDAKDCETSPRLTEVREDVPYNDIIGQMRAGFYREVTLVEGDEDAGMRDLLECHCLIDLDDDGYAEPYVVTLDESSEQVLRIEKNFGPQDVVVGIDGRVHSIRRECYYVKYDFFPNLEGGFYGLGLGHLLDNITKIVNNTINQMIDAGTAQAAGGGFVGSGVDLQSSKRGARIMFEPGAYKTVNVTGTDLRAGIYERTFPGPNPVTFQVLDLMLGAARDISGVKDVLTGEARNTGQVGTTLALIEQGLQVYTAIYKRVYRSLKEEFGKLFANIGRFGGQQAMQDYERVLDEPAALFEEDFNADDFDIRPVSDPSNVTKIQQAARAQYLGQFLGAPGMNPQAIVKRMLEAADTEDIDELFAPPQQPDPLMIEAAQAKIGKDTAGAQKDQATGQAALMQAQTKQAEEDRKRWEAIGQAYRDGLQQG